MRNGLFELLLLRRVIIVKHFRFLMPWCETLLHYLRYLPRIWVTRNICEKCLWRSVRSLLSSTNLLSFSQGRKRETLVYCSRSVVTRKMGRFSIEKNARTNLESTREMNLARPTDRSRKIAHANFFQYLVC